MREALTMPRFQHLDPGHHSASGSIAGVVANRVNHLFLDA